MNEYRAAGSTALSYLASQHLMNAVVIAAKVDISLPAVVIYLVRPGQSARCI
jgi:hypothetical protein